ncbi:MAG: hypothetical protein CW338_11135 [Clostridiales bacterium]|nr:hypothetical protein [Clostridiales bacterium]
MPNKKKKIENVYKPYVRGIPVTGTVIRRGLKLLVYQLVFAVFFLLGGGVFSGGAAVLRYIATVVVVFVCCALVWMDGSRDGMTDVTAGQNAYKHREAGKEITRAELEKCYHPLRSVVTFLAVALPLVLVSGLYACMAVKERIALPVAEWAGSASGSGAGEGLGYYIKTSPMKLVDILRVIVRICIFPFMNLADSNAKETRLLIDRLSPLLICIPFMAYIPAYLIAPRARAQTHGQIAAGEKKAQKKRARMEARKREREEKNRLI